MCVYIGIRMPKVTCVSGRAFAVPGAPEARGQVYLLSNFVMLFKLVSA